jgi:hypothetical protein
MKFIIMQFSPRSVFLPFRSKYPPQHSVLKNPQSLFLPQSECFFFHVPYIVLNITLVLTPCSWDRRNFPPNPDNILDCVSFHLTVLELKLQSLFTFLFTPPAYFSAEIYSDLPSPSIPPQLPTCEGILYVFFTVMPTLLSWVHHGDRITTT